MAAFEADNGMPLEPARRGSRHACKQVLGGPALFEGLSPTLAGDKDDSGLARGGSAHSAVFKRLDPADVIGMSVKRHRQSIWKEKPAERRVSRDDASSLRALD